MELTSYILSFVATILGLCEPFGKKMKTILTFNFLGNFLVGTSYILVSSFSGCAICFTACIQVLINYIFDKNGRKIPRWLLILHLVTFVSVNMLTFSYWYDIFSLGASIIFVLSIAQTNTRFYRLYYITNSLMWIFYDLLAGAYGNLFTHIVLSVSIFVAIILRDHSKQRN